MQRIQALQVPTGPAFVARPASRPGRARAPGSKRHAEHKNEGLTWLTEQAAGVEADVAAAAAAEAAAAADDSLARSVGLHLRGRAAFKEGAADEEDPARFFFHKALKQAAVAGSWPEAEAVLDDMARAGNVPGPRAYHALVFSYVKGRHAAGALGAIRRCWDAGITPLPETYAAVVHAHVLAGDLDTAEAVCASNRRAGVDCSKSWQQLVTALFKAGQAEKAVETYNQGAAEGLLPSEAVYEALIEYHCQQGDLQGAAAVLQEMREGSINPTIQHFKPLISAQAAAGNPQAAYLLMQELLSSGRFPPGMLDVCDTVLEAQLLAAGTGEEVAQHVGRMKAIMVGNGLQPGSRFFVAQLQAALRLQDVQAAVQAFRALRHRTVGALQGINDELLGKLLVAVSHAGLPAELYELLGAMTREERSIPAAAMAPDQDGCSVLGAWVQRRLAQATTLQQGGEEGEGENGAADTQLPWIVIDGVHVHPVTLTCVDATGSALAVTRLGVKELRAELAARRAPVSGNKKDLTKRLQKLRQLDGTRSSSSSLQKLRTDQKSDARRKVAVVVTDHMWVDGKMVQETRYESESEVEAVQEEEADDVQEWDMEEEEAPTTRRAALDDELLFDEDLATPTSARAPYEHRYVLACAPHFSNPIAGPHEAASMVLGAVTDLKAQPTAADLRVVSHYIHQTGDISAAVLLAAAVDRLPSTSIVEGSQQLREELAAFCSSQEVDLDAAIESLLKQKEQDGEEMDMDIDYSDDE